MLTILKNDNFEATINSHGAELKSLKNTNNGTEYIWNGNAEYWTGSSPVLFPIVGKVFNNEIHVDGKAYPLENHGFCRKGEFELIESNDTIAIFQYKYNDESLKMYPFKFILELKYTLKDNGIQIDYTVYNNDNKVLPFQLGTHPAFNCPFDNTKLTDWYFEFEKNETLDAMKVIDNIASKGNLKRVLTNDKKLDLSHELYFDGVLAFKDINSRSVTLKSEKSDKNINVTFSGFKDFGTWQPKNAPFVCIEPWYGHFDYEGFTGDITEKPNMLKIEKGTNYKAQIKISVN